MRKIITLTAVLSLTACGAGTDGDSTEQVGGLLLMKHRLIMIREVALRLFLWVPSLVVV